MQLKEAIELLRTIVNYSAVPGQKRVNMELVSASERPRFQEALKVANQAVKDGELTQAELQSQLGLD